MYMYVIECVPPLFCAKEENAPFYIYVCIYVYILNMYTGSPSLH